MQRFYESSLERCKQESNADESYYNAISVTTTYNLSRLHESLCEFDKAEALYKNILREHPNYVDCKSTKILMNLFNYFARLRVKCNFWSLKCWFYEICYSCCSFMYFFSWCWVILGFSYFWVEAVEFCNKYIWNMMLNIQMNMYVHLALLCWIYCVLHSLHMVFIFLLPLNGWYYTQVRAKCLYGSHNKWNPCDFCRLP